MSWNHENTDTTSCSGRSAMRRIWLWRGATAALAALALGASGLRGTAQEQAPAANTADTAAAAEAKTDDKAAAEQPAAGKDEAKPAAVAPAAAEPAKEAPAADAKPAPAATGVGLALILPQLELGDEATNPVEIADLIGVLPETWKAWGTELTGELTRLYREPGDLANQKQLLDALRQKLQSLEVAVQDYRYKPAQEKLSALRGEVLRRVTLLEVLMDILAATPTASEAALELVTAVEEFEANGLAADGQSAVDALHRLKAVAGPQADRLTTVFRDGYQNYNLRVLVSEGFLNKIVSERRAENGIVDDCILGAKVDGCQTTWTSVGIDLVPSYGMAKLCLYADGQIQSNTQGVTRQATIYTAGNHSFRAEKPIYFDGDNFMTQPAGVGVNANNTTVGADTIYDWIPLLGRFANKKAIEESIKKKPESEAIARGKISSQLLPKFNSEVDRKFGVGGDLNGQLQPALTRVKAKNVYPQTKSYYSTDNWLIGDARLATDTELAANTPVGGLAIDGCYVQIHESFLGNTLSRAGLAGKRYTEEQVVQVLTDWFSELLGKKLETPKVVEKAGGKDDQLTFIFDATDPIRFKAVNGELTLLIRAAIEQTKAAKDGAQPEVMSIPAQEIAVPLRTKIEGEKILITRGDVQVAAVERPEGIAERAEQVTRARVIKDRFEKAIEPREEDRAFYVDKDGVRLQLKVDEITTADGWMTVRIR